MSNAEAWVGDSQPGDRLDLESIRSELPDGTVLKAILEDPEVAGRDTMRQEASATAAKSRDMFRRTSIVAVLGTAVATLASGLLLYGAGSDAATTGDAAPVQQGLVQWVAGNRTSFTWVQVVGLFLTTAATAQLGFEDYSGRWTGSRRRAETLRTEIFSKVLELAAQRTPGPSPAADPGNPVRQALEFFRRYQLELQIAFYGSSGSRHRSLAGVLAWITAVLAGVAAIAGTIGGLSGTAPVLSAFLGIAVPVLLSAAQSWRATTRDTNAASSYQNAMNALREAAFDLTKVRGKADLADVDAVKAYFDRVHLAIASENERWVPEAPGAAGP